MARQIRHIYPGAIYHIINHGSRRENIFRKDGDKEDLYRQINSIRDTLVENGFDGEGFIDMLLLLNQKSFNYFSIKLGKCNSDKEEPVYMSLSVPFFYTKEDILITCLSTSGKMGGRMSIVIYKVINDKLERILKMPLIIS